MARVPAIDRAMRRVVAGPNGCWIWSGALTKGYGVLANPGGTREAHRIVYEHYRGPIPEGLELDHLCRMPRCVNPWHLEAVTHQENVRRGMSPAMVAQRKGRCIRGHSLADAHRRKSNGEVIRCRTCHNESRRMKAVA